MRKLKIIGFFRELRHGDPAGECLRVAMQTHAIYPTDQVAAYLRSAPVLIACPGVVGDVLAEEDGIMIGTPHICTDGDWAWPQDLAYYVRTYRIALDPAFLEHLATRGYLPPKEAELDLSALKMPAFPLAPAEKF